MSMSKEAYELANRIKTELRADGECLTEGPGDVEMKRYKTTVLDEIKKEKKRTRRRLGKVSAAACVVVALAAGTTVFGEEVHAAIRQISWSISSALGTQADLENYREVVQTSVSDNGYVVTLHEAVASEEKLVVNFTIQREDGQPMDDILTPDEGLYINGKAIHDGAGGSAWFLDETHAIVGVETSHEAPGVDLSGENTYQIKIRQLGYEDGVKGKWDFAFTADGTDLIADTKRFSIGKEFTLPDGVTLSLDEYTSNDLEQRIIYRTSKSTRYDLMIMAVDQDGRQTEFGVRMADQTSGYMQNQEVLYDGRIAENAGEVTFTLFAVEFPEEDGRMSDDYEQVGEPFVLEL